MTPAPNPCPGPPMGEAAAKGSEGLATHLRISFEKIRQLGVDFRASLVLNAAHLGPLEALVEIIVVFGRGTASKGLLATLGRDLLPRGPGEGMVAVSLGAKFSSYRTRKKWDRRHRKGL